MTAMVRIFAHDGVVSASIAGRALSTTDEALVLLKQPYLGREALTADVTAVESDAANAPSGTTILVVEVETGKTITYEVSHPNADLRTADVDSPRLTGRNVIHFGPGCRLSVLDVSA
jgi:hypothetical protein